MQSPFKPAAVATGSEGTYRVRIRSKYYLPAMADDAVPWGSLRSWNPAFEDVVLTEAQVTFGRGKNCLVRYAKEKSLSKIHATICYEFVTDREIAVFVEDSSSNGTFVDGTRVGKGNRVRLRDGGNVSFVGPHDANVDGGPRAVWCVYACACACVCARARARGGAGCCFQNSLRSLVSHAAGNCTHSNHTPPSHPISLPPCAAHSQHHCLSVSLQHRGAAPGRRGIGGHVVRGYRRRGVHPGTLSLAPQGRARLRHARHSPPGSRGPLCCRRRHYCGLSRADGRCAKKTGCQHRKR